MKLGKTLKVASIFLLASAVLAACSSNTSNSSTSDSLSVSKLDEKNLDGQYYSEKNSNGERMILEIDGKDVLASVGTRSQVTTINTSKKTIEIDGRKNKYKIIGNKLVIQLKEGDVAFVKGTPPESDTSSSSTSSSATSSSSSSKTTSTSSSSTTKDSEKIYSDSYIEVTKKGSVLTFKNISSQDIVIDGKAYLDDSYEINMYSFGYIGDIKANALKTENISKLILTNQGKDGDTESGETIGGDQTYNHITKSGEKITWSGTIQDSSYNDIGSVSFDFIY